MKLNRLISTVLRTLPTGLLCVMIAGAPVMAQTEAEKKAETDKKAAADKAAADKGAAEQAEADKKAAAEKQAADKLAAEKKKVEAAKVATDDSIYGKSGAALTMLFVIAVLLENAFAVIFEWRVFLAYFSVRGIKPIIMIVASLAIVHGFDLDIVANLIAAFKSLKDMPPIEPGTITGPVSKVITALILAGGSAGINRIMHALGIRSETREEDAVPKPPSKKAWIAVHVSGQAARAKGIQVKLKEIPAAQVQNPPDPIAGGIGGQRVPVSSLILRNTDRFPQNGGYTVTPGVVYEIRVEATDENGAPLTALGKQYAFAEGAIVDFEVSAFESK